MSSWIEDGNLGGRYLVGQGDRTEEDSEERDPAGNMEASTSEGSTARNPLYTYWISFILILKGEVALSNRQVDQIRKVYEIVRQADGGLADEEYEIEVGAFWEEGHLRHGLVKRKTDVIFRGLERRARRLVRNHRYRSHLFQDGAEENCEISPFQSHSIE